MKTRTISLLLAIVSAALVAAPSSAELHCLGCHLNKIKPSSRLPCLTVTTTTFSTLSGSCFPDDDSCIPDPCFVNMIARFESTCPGPIYINVKTGSGCSAAGEVNPGQPFSPTYYGNVDCGEMKIYRAYLGSDDGCGAGNAVGQVGFICTTCLAATTSTPTSQDGSGRGE